MSHEDPLLQSDEALSDFANELQLIQQMPELSHLIYTPLQLHSASLPSFPSEQSNVHHVASQIATVMIRLQHLAEPQTQQLMTTRAMLCELNDIIRHALFISFPESMRHVGESIETMRASCHVYFSNRRIPLSAMARGLYLLTYTSVKLRIELVMLTLQRRIEEELRQIDHYSAKTANDDNTINQYEPFGEENEEVADLLITQTLLGDAMNLYNNILLLVPLLQYAPLSTGSSMLSHYSAHHLSGATPISSLIPVFVRYYYQLCDWILLCENTSQSRSIVANLALDTSTTQQTQESSISSHPAYNNAETDKLNAMLSTMSFTSIKKMELDARKGTLELSLQRPSIHSPWGLLFNEEQQLVDIDVALRVRPNAQQLHELLRSTAHDGVAIVGINHTRISARQIAKEQKSETHYSSNNNSNEASSSSEAATANEVVVCSAASVPHGVMSLLAEASAHRKTLHLTLQSNAFKERSWCTPVVLAFMYFCQGNESSTGQRALLLLNRLSCTRTPWNFTLTQEITSEGKMSDEFYHKANDTMNMLSSTTTTFATKPLFFNILDLHHSLRSMTNLQEAKNAEVFFHKFANRLALRAVNGTLVSSVAEVSALVASAETVLLDLVVVSHACSLRKASTRATPHTRHITKRYDMTQNSNRNYRHDDDNEENVDSIEEYDGNEQELTTSITNRELQTASMPIKNVKGKKTGNAKAIGDINAKEMLSNTSGNSSNPYISESEEDKLINRLFNEFLNRHKKHVDHDSENANVDASNESNKELYMEEHLHDDVNDNQDVELTQDDDTNTQTDDLTAANELYSDTHDAKEMLLSTKPKKAHSQFHTKDVNMAIINESINDNNDEDDAQNQLDAKQIQNDSNNNNNFSQDDETIYFEDDKETNEENMTLEKNNDDENILDSAVAGEQIDHEELDIIDNDNNVEMDDDTLPNENMRSNRLASDRASAVAKIKSKRNSTHKRVKQSALHNVPVNTKEEELNENDNPIVTASEIRHAINEEISGGVDTNNTVNEISENNDVVQEEHEQVLHNTEHDDTTDSANEATLTNTTNSISPCVLKNGVKILSYKDDTIVLERPSVDGPWGLKVEHTTDLSQSPFRLPLQLIQLPLPEGNKAVYNHPFVQAFMRDKLKGDGMYIMSINKHRANNFEAALRQISSLKRMTLKLLKK